MYKHKFRAKTTHPWNSFGGWFWLIGLIILASNDWWWPGILVLIGLSMVMSSIFRESGEIKPLEPVAPPQPVPASRISPEPTPPQPFSPEQPAFTPRSDLLPATCPRCGGPVRPAEITWRGPQAASCALRTAQAAGWPRHLEDGR